MRFFPRFRRGLQPTQNRVWFPLEEGQIKGRVLVDIAAIAKNGFAKLGVKPTFKTLFTLVEPRSLRELDGMDEISAALSTGLIMLRTGQMGLIIPAQELGDDWNFRFKITPDSIRFISFLVSLKIRHSNDYIQAHLVGSDQPLHDLQRGEGNCFSKASILCAVLRKNGVNARIVGNMNFHDIDSPHFWVEAFLGSKWISIDTDFNNFGVAAAKYLMETFSSDRDKMNALKYLAQHPAVPGFGFTSIESEIYRDKVDERFIAAEFAIPNSE